MIGHDLRSDKDIICKTGLELEVPGKRPKGRPKQRYFDTLHANLKLGGIHPDHAFVRIKRCQWTNKVDPATKLDKRLR